MVQMILVFLILYTLLKSDFDAPPAIIRHTCKDCPPVLHMKRRKTRVSRAAFNTSASARRRSFHRRGRRAPRCPAGCGWRSAGVRPSPRSLRNSARISSTPSLSSPFIGSSRISSFGPFHQRLRDAQPLAHSQRIARDVLAAVRIQPDALHRLADVQRVDLPADVGQKLQVAKARIVGQEARRLDDRAEARRRFDVAPDRLAVDADRARGRRATARRCT